MKPNLKRWSARAALLLGLMAVTALSVAGCVALGARATGPRRVRMTRSPEWNDGQFVNPQPLINALWGSIAAMWRTDANVSPLGAVPHVTVEKSRFDAAPASGLRVTWLGHSAVLLEIDGHRFLTDPVWIERMTPVNGIGPQRWFPPLIALADLPKLDAVVISHDHFDHLDYPTVVALNRLGVPFIVPLGVGAHLVHWGVPEKNIVELDWWQTRRLGDLAVTCTPARHASGRMLIDTDTKLWAGYAFVGSKHRVYFSGDTGLFPSLHEIGARLGPFDLTMIEVGQYNAAWPDWHSGPEQAVTAHQWVGGRVMLPIHWGLFALAAHGWTEPIERTLVAAAKSHVVVMTPRPGESVDPMAPPAVTHWWPSLPWHTAAQDPIVSDHVN